MSSIIIGDIHGRPIWETIVAQHPYDDIIFLGDYFDSKENITPEAQILNFRRILDFKKSHPQRVTLLLGNHDFHYLPEAGQKYSGYQDTHAPAIFDILQAALAKKGFCICVQKGKYLASHAGLTRTWCQNHHIPLDNPVEDVNKLFYARPEAFRFAPGPAHDPCGDEPEQGPLWVRPDSLQMDYLRGFVQVVGHTQHPTITFSAHAIFADVLSFSPKYLEINEKGETFIRNIQGI